jgi:hypothetical protein
MYAVVYQNKVIVGPMSWNRAIFQGSLERRGILDTLPRVAPEELPYVINDDAQIMAVEEVRPEMNPMVEYYYGPLWEITETKAIANYEVVDTNIEFARNNFKSKAAEERWKKETAGTKITINGVEVSLDTTRDGRNVFIQKFVMMGANDTVNWKFPESWVTLSKSDFDTIITAIDTHVESCFTWEKSIVDQIDESETKEDLLAIVIVEKEEVSPELTQE